MNCLVVQPLRSRLALSMFDLKLANLLERLRSLATHSHIDLKTKEIINDFIDFQNNQNR
jgi:hypothetical protein